MDTNTTLTEARSAMREAIALLQSHRNERARRVLADADKHLTAALARGKGA